LAIDLFVGDLPHGIDPLPPLVVGVAPPLDWHLRRRTPASIGIDPVDVIVVRAHDGDRPVAPRPLVRHREGLICIRIVRLGGPPAGFCLMSIAMRPWTGVLSHATVSMRRVSKSPRTMGAESGFTGIISTF
jgi:hypothetical protein